MALDGLFLHHLTNELHNSLVGGRINKIYQVGKNEFLFIIYNKKKYKLYITLSGDRSRCNITDKDFHYPNNAPMWSMILRKHLSNAYLLDIYQHERDRVITFKFSFTNAIGDTSIKYLTLELMGRHSNMILHDDDKIFDCVKHLNSHRLLLPGVQYQYPETRKELPIDIDSNLPELDIIKKYQGVSKWGAKLIKENVGKINSSNPTLFENGYYFNNIEEIQGERKFYSTLSELLDDYFYLKDVKDRIKQTTENLSKFINHEISKNRKKLKNLEKDLHKAENADQYRLYGELLYANQYQISKGDKAFTTFDYEGNQVTIPLNVLNTPSQNAKKYFNKYQKAKNGLVIIQEQIDKTEEELDYLDNIDVMLKNCKLKDALEIKDELTSLGYFRKRKAHKNTKKRKHVPAFEKFISPEGIEILVGKNNVQNDYITFKEANKNDIWMHAKDIPGSHIVIRMSEPTETTIRYAANIAALYSKAKNSSSVPVDYTLVKHVKKVPGKKPGFVIISNQKTIYIDPDEELL